MTLSYLFITITIRSPTRYSDDLYVLEDKDFHYIYILFIKQL